MIAKGIPSRLEGFVLPHQMMTAGKVQPCQIRSLPPPWWGPASRLPQQLLWSVSPMFPSLGTLGTTSHHRHWVLSLPNKGFLA